MKNEELFDFIERYFANELSRKQRKKFEELQQSDSNFRQKVDNYQRIQDFMEHLDAERVEMNLIQNTEFLSPAEKERLQNLIYTSNSRTTIPLPRILATSAAIILLIIIVWVTIPSINTPSSSEISVADESEAPRNPQPEDPEIIQQFLANASEEKTALFQPDPLRENRIYSPVLSDENVVIMTPQNREILDDQVIFQWESNNNQALVFTLYDNQGNILQESEGHTEPITLSLAEYSIGRYYWQLSEVDGQVIHMDVFFIYRP